MQTNPLSYGGIPIRYLLLRKRFSAGRIIDNIFHIFVIFPIKIATQKANIQN